jgi:hypothetical protein
MNNQDKTCTLCGELFETDRELREHQRTEHLPTAGRLRSFVSEPDDSDYRDSDFGEEETAA